MGKVAEKLGTQSTWAPERLTSSDHFEISDRPKAASSSGFMLRSSRPCAPSLATTSLLAMAWAAASRKRARRSEEHTSELQSLMRISYAVFCLKKKKKQTQNNT